MCDVRSPQRMDLSQQTTRTMTPVDGDSPLGREEMEAVGMRPVTGSLTLRRGARTNPLLIQLIRHLSPSGNQEPLSEEGQMLTQEHEPGG